MTAFTDFVNLELPRRPAILTFEITAYAGDPNLGPAILNGAPKGTFFLNNTDNVLWTKQAAGATTWVPVATNGKTTSSLTYYVATTGSDTNDGLTVGTPLLTIQAAINKIPKIVQHNVTINIAAGTYSGQVFFEGFTIASSAIVTITGGNMTSSTLATGTATGTVGIVTAATNANLQSFQDLSQTWTPGDLRGRWVSIAGSTAYRIISGNTATSMTLVGAGTVTAGQTYAIVEPAATITASTASGVPTLTVQCLTNKPNNNLQFLNLAIVNTGASGVYAVQAYGGSVFSRCSATVSCSGGAAVKVDGGYCTWSSSVAKHTGAGVGYVMAVNFLLSTSSDALGFNNSYFLSTGALTALADVVINNCGAVNALGAVFERTIARSQTILLMHGIGKGQSQSQGFTFVAPVGNTGTAWQLGFETSSAGGGYSFMSINNLLATNFGTALLCTTPAQRAMVGTSVLTNCTTGFAASYGGQIRVTSTPVFSGVTNEFTLDGTAYTDAVVTATTPLPIISNLQTFASIGRY
jgi:hypothetical protein